MTLTTLKEHPVFGIGPGNISAYIGGQVTHNAFLNMYGDVGFVGGTFFVGDFLLCFARLVAPSIGDNAMRQCP